MGPWFPLRQLGLLRGSNSNHRFRGATRRGARVAVTTSGLACGMPRPQAGRLWLRLHTKSSSFEIDHYVYQLGVSLKAFAARFCQGGCATLLGGTSVFVSLIPRKLNPYGKKEVPPGGWRNLPSWRNLRRLFW